MLVGAVLLSALAVPAAAQSDGEAFELGTESVSSTADVTIRGTTTLEAGTDLQVRVQSAGETSPQFLKTAPATVGSNGSWNATFDFSDIKTHDSISVSVVAVNGEQSANFEVPIRNDQATPTATGSGASTPGFGVVVALAALLGSIAVTRIRR